jgi:hypothetical protein
LPQMSWVSWLLSYRAFIFWASGSLWRVFNYRWVCSLLQLDDHFRFGNTMPPTIPGCCRSPMSCSCAGCSGYHPGSAIPSRRNPQARPQMTLTPQMYSFPLLLEIHGGLWNYTIWDTKSKPRVWEQQRQSHRVWNCYMYVTFFKVSLQLTHCV